MKFIKVFNLNKTKIKIILFELAATVFAVQRKFLKSLPDCEANPF